MWPTGLAAFAHLATAVGNHVSNALHARFRPQMPPLAERGGINKDTASTTVVVAQVWQRSETWKQKRANMRASVSMRGGY